MAKSRQKRRCRHCGRHVVARPRGLCWICYYDPEIVKSYPSTMKRGVISAPRGAPSLPTDALPGSPQKVAVFIQRAERGEWLWHPEDAIMDEE